MIKCVVSDLVPFVVFTSNEAGKRLRISPNVEELKMMIKGIDVKAAAIL